MKYSLEICAGSLNSALAAQQGGADRIELCANLPEGGTTPSIDMLKKCKELLDIPVFAIIRPRGGNFVYSDQEFDVMKRDLECCLELGCDGVVFGILLPNGRIDMQRCAELLLLARDKQRTFHRAFDHCTNRRKGLEDLITLGFNRVLTSGGMEYAEDAIAELTRLVTQGGNRISIMPGSGVTEKNLSRIAIETGACEFHSTAKGTIGQCSQQNDFITAYPIETDIEKVVQMRNLLSFLNP